MVCVGDIVQVKLAARHPDVQLLQVCNFLRVREITVATTYECEDANGVRFAVPEQGVVMSCDHCGKAEPIGQGT